MNLWCINKDLLVKDELLILWNSTLPEEKELTKIEMARLLDYITKQQTSAGWSPWNKEIK